MATKYDLYDDSAPIPEKIYIDTNFIVALFTPKTQEDLLNKNVCESFLEKLKQHKVKLFTSDITYVELYHQIIKRVLNSFSERTFSHKYKTDPTRIRPCFPELESILKICYEQGISPIRVDQKSDLPLAILTNIKNSCLLSNDSFHYSTAKEFGISSFLSLDGDFDNIDDEITVYTISKSVL